MNLNQEKKWIPIISLLIGVVVLIVKFYAYHVTNSQSIFSDALESIVNVVAGIITIVVIVIAARPADQDHPYGHGKLESIAATFEGGAITLAGILIIIQSIQIFFHGAVLTALDTGLYLTIGAGLVNGILGLILKSSGKKNHSEAMISSGAHLLGDALTSIGVIIAIVLVKVTGKVWIDPFIAALFGGMLCYSGGKILWRSGHNLLDGHDYETLSNLASLFEKHYVSGVIDIHYTRVIRSGAFHHIDCHMVIPEFWSIAEGHSFSEHFEASFVNNYSTQAELKIHLDPCRRVYCENCEVGDCPIRQKNFVKRTPLDNLDEVTSPIESR